jgi:tetraacyldisaccharide 4'-kinase
LSTAPYWNRLVSGQERGPLAAAARAGLWGASLFFGLGAAVRGVLYSLGLARVHRLPVPVVSIGNITVGGTGKTPFVELVCRKLTAMGRRPAILTRGYKAGPHGSDEAALLAERLPGVPVVVDPDRVAGGRRAVAEHSADVLVLDDGFQHRRLHRDLDIVLTDWAAPLGNGRMLPAGHLREPASALRRASLIVRTRCPVGDELRHPGSPFPPGVPLLRCRHTVTDVLRFPGPGDEPVTLEPTAVRARDALAFCGLADPSGFTRSLREWGCRVVGERAFPDHHAFTAADVDALSAARPAGADLVTTEKDLQRLLWLPAEQRRKLYPLAVVRIRMEILSGERELDARLAALPFAGPAT